MHSEKRAAFLPSLLPDRARSLLRHPVRAIEHAALDGVRRAFRTTELFAPVHAFLNEHRVHIVRNVPYMGTGHPAHLLDVYRPADAAHSANLPVVFYIHGGGFETCSKDSHYVMARSYAESGYVVFNVNYRLAPKYAFPFGLMDVCSAYLWTLDNAMRFGGDPSRMVVAGDSAGANLAASLTLMSAVERPESWASAVYRRHAMPKAVVAACGFFEVANSRRFRHVAHDSWELTKRTIEHIGRAYLPHKPRFDGEHDLANPLHILERGERFSRALPAFFLPCGTRDPIVDDTRRFASALRRHGVRNEARYYDGEHHAFHALVWREQAQLCWEHTLEFVAAELRAAAVPAAKTRAA